MAGYIDTHAHLTDARLNAAEILAAFAQDGIDYAVTVGYDMPSSRACAALAARERDVYAVIGVHPHDAKTLRPEDRDELTLLARSEKVLGIGEIGLDYYYDRSERDVQKRAFAEQLEWADALGLPVVLHVRDATGDCNEILRQNRHYLRHGGLMHCYACGAELVPWYADLGFRFAFGGSVTFRNAPKLAEAVRAVPDDRILTETDCPYLTPEPFRGRPNQPKYLQYIVRKLAELRNTTEEALKEQVRKNALSLFPRLAGRSASARR